MQNVVTHQPRHQRAGRLRNRGRPSLERRDEPADGDSIKIPLNPIFISRMRSRAGDISLDWCGAFKSPNNKVRFPCSQPIDDSFFSEWAAA